MNMLKPTLIALFLAHAGVGLAAERIGVILFSTGSAKAIGSDGKERELKKGDAVFEGDRIVTDGNAIGQIKLDDGSRVGVRPQSDVKFQNIAKLGGSGLILLDQGSIRFISTDTTSKNQFTVQTTTSKMEVSKADIETAVVKDAAKGDTSFVKVNTGNTVVVTDTGKVPVDLHQTSTMTRLSQNPVLTSANVLTFGQPGNSMPTVKGTTTLVDNTGLRGAAPAPEVPKTVLASNFTANIDSNLLKGANTNQLILNNSLTGVVGPSKANDPPPPPPATVPKTLVNADPGLKEANLTRFEASAASLGLTAAINTSSSKGGTVAAASTVSSRTVTSFSLKRK